MNRCEICVKLEMSYEVDSVKGLKCSLSLTHTHTRGIQDFRQLIKVKNSTNVKEYSNPFELLYKSDKERLQSVSQSYTTSCQIVFLHSVPNRRHGRLESVAMATAEHSSIRTRTVQQQMPSFNPRKPDIK